jgi:CheY-like chemotaxis protein
VSITPAKKILVVEDFEDSRAVLRQLLEIEGYQILEASDGQQAVETALREAPHLILMDVSLPTLDGFQAARQIRAAIGGHAPPIIIISAYDNNEARAEALEVGCSGYITKPIDFDLLEELVGKYLKQ